MKKRIMVDMSATLIHHGHIRLLKKASEYGSVIVGLTTDNEIISKKNYQPELSFEYRKEILESIKYVSEVVATPWLIDDTATINSDSLASNVTCLVGCQEECCMGDIFR